MKLRIFASALIIWVMQHATAQTPALYMPLEFKKAYESGTRKWDGSVSPEYFQNQAKYKINAKIEPYTRKLSATGSITYYNNSPLSLDKIVFHSYKDLYTEGMVIESISVRNKSLNLQNRSEIKKSQTYYTIKLDKSLEPKDSIQLDIKWSISIPEKVNRDGAYDKTSMLVAYWYPEIAVIDDIFGWDEIDFDGRAEFYHDFSDFDITIDIPTNFVVWASDAPKNAESIYPNTMLTKIKEASTSTEPTSIISSRELKKGLKMKSGTWKYQVSDFPDFSFAFSDHYLWDACRYEDEMGVYQLNSAYPEVNASFKDVISIEKSALDIFHHKFPKYPFPFKHFVAFNGETGGGMEFAGMCNDQAKTNYHSEGIAFSDWDANKLLTVHEMMHMYFPFMMGINEKRFAWMDEGMAEFAEDAFTSINLESTQSREKFASMKIAPMMVQTYTIPYSYTTTTYDISSQSYFALMEMLGKELFDLCMKTYMDTWKGHHPSPYDFFFSFNTTANEDLNWFWKAWYLDWGYPDMGIKSFENNQLIIENLGGLPIAINLEITDSKGNKDIHQVNPRVWKNSALNTIDLSKYNDIQVIELKTLNGADAVYSNNFWRK